MSHISNALLTVEEKGWLEALLEGASEETAKLVSQQINSAAVLRESARGFRSIMFDVPDDVEEIPPFKHEPVLLDMFVEDELSSKYPVDFLIHVKNGKLVELEVYNVGGDVLPRCLSLQNRTVRDYSHLPVCHGIDET